MKKNILLLVFIVLILVGCSNNDTKDNKLNIAVSIKPEEAFVNAVVGDKGNITTVIPSGFSPANYQPSPKELEEISDSDLYFSIGIAAENNIIPKIINTSTDIISLKDATLEKYPLLYINSLETEEANADPHIWMSPKRVIEMVNLVKDSIISLDPENKDYYSTNAEKYISELEELDEYTRKTINDNSFKDFVIYHPSLGYFADDYGLNMVVIEEGGKNATIETISEVISFAKDNNIKIIFYQEEFDSKQANVIAEEINGKTISLDILSEDYINNFKKIVDTFVSSY